MKSCGEFLEWSHTLRVEGRSDDRVSIHKVVVTITIVGNPIGVGRDSRGKIGDD